MFPLPVSITLKNPYGYLDAADYPAMVFYAVMLVVYVVLAVVWAVLLCCSYKDLIRLQVGEVRGRGGVREGLCIVPVAVQIPESPRSYVWCCSTHKHTHTAQ